MEKNTTRPGKSQRSMHKQKYILDEQQRVIKSNTQRGKGRNTQNETMSRRKKVECEFLPHCVTQTVVWRFSDSPSGFSLSPSKRSTLLLNYLLPPLPVYATVHLPSLCQCLCLQLVLKVCLHACMCVCFLHFHLAPAVAVPTTPAPARTGVTLRHRPVL